MKKWIKLSNWAKSVGLSYRTAHKHFKEGKIPHETKILPSGGLLVCADENNIFVDSHIHFSYGEVNLNSVKFINASQLNEAYHMTNEPILVQL